MPTLQATVPIAIIVLTAVTLLVRQLWLASQIEEYGFNALYYCQRNKLSVVIADEMSQIWPGHIMLLEIWRWDFSRYIVHQDHLESMNAFIASELARKDLDLARWEVENKTLGEEPSDKPTDQSQPPSPPTP